MYHRALCTLYLALRGLVQVYLFPRQDGVAAETGNYEPDKAIKTQALQAIPTGEKMLNPRILKKAL